MASSCNILGPAAVNQKYVYMGWEGEETGVVQTHRFNQFIKAEDQMAKEHPPEKILIFAKIQRNAD